MSITRRLTRLEELRTQASQRASRITPDERAARIAQILSSPTNTPARSRVRELLAIAAQRMRDALASQKD